MEELIICIALTTGQYGKALPSGLSITGELNFNITMFSNGEWNVLLSNTLNCTLIQYSALKCYVEDIFSMFCSSTVEPLMHLSDYECSLYTLLYSASLLTVEC